MTIIQPDWSAWHDDYDRPGSSIAIRLTLVQEQLRRALDDAVPGPVRVVSICGGQGRDIIEVLPHHPRNGDVSARIVELDERNVAYARASAAQHNLRNVDVVSSDGSATDAYLGAVPAEIVLVCGVFGNMSDADVHATIERLPEFCAPSATVIWTRNRREPDLTPEFLRWFGDCGFEPIIVAAPEHTSQIGVGAHRFIGTPRALKPHQSIFTFVRDR